MDPHEEMFFAIMLTGAIIIGLIIIGLVLQVFNFVRTAKIEREIKDSITCLKLPNQKK